MILKYPFSRPKRAIYLFLNYVSLLNFFIHSFTILLFPSPLFLFSSSSTILLFFRLLIHLLIFKIYFTFHHHHHISIVFTPPIVFLPTILVLWVGPFWSEFGLLGLILAILAWGWPFWPVWQENNRGSESDINVVVVLVEEGNNRNVVVVVERKNI